MEKSFFFCLLFFFFWGGGGGGGGFECKYHPIGTFSECSIVPAKIILDIIERYSVITDHQFGVKRCHSTPLTG